MNHTRVHVEEYMVPLGAGHYHVIGTSTNEIAYCARHDDAVRLVKSCNAHEELVAELKRTLMNARASQATDWETVVERITHTLNVVEKGV